MTFNPSYPIGLPMMAVHKRIHELFCLALLGALLFQSAAPVQAAPRQTFRLLIANDRVLTTFCFDMVPDARSEQFLQTTDLPTLLAFVRAIGARTCKNDSSMQLAARAQATTPNQAGLVIDFGDGRVMSFCVDLGSTGQVTGEELLRASNLPLILEYTAIGASVCKIDTVGSNFPAEDCFASCTLRPGETCVYWTYWHLLNNQWQFSNIGLSNYILHAGDVDAWAWGESATDSGKKPPLHTFSEICAAMSPSITPTSTFTPTPILGSPTATPMSSATALPTVAPVVIITSNNTATPYLTWTPTAQPSVTTIPTATPTAVATELPTTIPTVFVAALIATQTPISADILTSTLMLAEPTPTSTPDTFNAVEGPLAVLPTPAASAYDVRLPLIQHGVSQPTATATLVPVMPTPITIGEVATPNRLLEHATTVNAATPQVPAAGVLSAQSDNPTRTYPYFGVLVGFLLIMWVGLRRRNVREQQ